MALPAKFRVLLIDAQNDFSDALMPDGGADGMGLKFGKGSMGKLPVTGAKEDMGRITNFLNTYKDAIEDVYASMDTHTLGHIGHMFWRSTDGQIAPPSTVFSIKTALDGSTAIIGTQYLPEGIIEKEYEVNVDDTVHRKVLNKYATHYILEVGSKGKQGRTAVNTWNIHCIEGSVGWNIAPNIKSALEPMEAAGKVHYYIKGQNQLAEMYSIFAAEVPYEELIELKDSTGNNVFTGEEKNILKLYVYNDSYEKKGVDFNESTKTPDFKLKASNEKAAPKSNSNRSYPSFADAKYNLQTTFNEELYEKLTAGDLPIIVCGEALSHCVQFSARDLITRIAKDNKPNKVYILQGGSSAVDLGPGSPLTAAFKESANKFLMDMKDGKDMGGSPVNTGLLVLNDEGIISIPAAGGRRRRNRKTRRHRKAKKSKKTRKH